MLSTRRAGIAKPNKMEKILRRDFPFLFEEEASSVACDFIESKKHYLIIAELPGMKKEDIHVELKQDVISIHGDRGTKAKEEEFLLEERPRGKFHRRFALPSKEEIDISKINAEYKNGLLTISIPKKQVATKIKIK